MTVQQRDAFLAKARIATLVTLDADGSPTAVPVWFEWDGERPRLFTGRGSPKLRRIARDARVTLMVAEPVGMPEAWVSIEGTARVEEGGMAIAERLTPRYYTPERAERALADWRKLAGQWVTIVIEPRRIRSLAPE